MTYGCALKFPSFPIIYGKGLYESLMALVSYDKSTLLALLPSELELAPQRITESDKHPLMFFFGKQMDIRPNFIPSGMGITYHEFVVLIPYVQWRSKSDAYHGPFAFMPMLYLDQVFPTVLGYLYGYNNMIARIRNTQGYRIHSAILDKPFIKSEHTTHGAKMLAHAFPNFKNIKPILSLPLIAQHFTGFYIASSLAFTCDEMMVQGAHANVTIQHEFLEGLPPQHFSLEPLDTTPLGAFSMRAPRTILPPIWP